MGAIGEELARLWSWEERHRRLFGRLGVVLLATLVVGALGTVVIYFTEPVRDQLHKLMGGALRPGGYLMIGSSERVSTPQAFGLESSHPFIYRKV